MNTLQAEIVKMDIPTLPSPKASIPEEEVVPEPSGIEIQTSNLNPNLRMQIRRSRRSFQN
jgi:hypothetical protein